jgi:ribosome biogenesis GTPase
VALDTPGLRMVRPWGMRPEDLPGAFREFRALPPCRFTDCLHRDEPGCAVREAQTQGRVEASRYGSYLRILTTLEGGGSRNDSVSGSRRKRRGGVPPR